MQKQNPYRSIDKRMAKVIRNAKAEFHNLRLKFSIDHLNVVTLRKKVNAMYGRMDKRNRAAYIAEFLAMYEEASDGGTLTAKAAEKAVQSILERYDPVTEFVYTKEVNRKAERLVESIAASQSTTQVQAAIKRAQNLWVAQSKQYGDEIVDEAMVKGFKDAGVKRVRWITQHDERRCKHCADLDGRIFPIDDIPPKQHRNCRCYVLPVE